MTLSAQAMLSVVDPREKMAAVSQLEAELNQEQLRFAEAHGCTGALALPGGRAAVYRFDGHATLRWILDGAGEVVDTACFSASEDA
jgi:hypothetical protein